MYYDYDSAYYAICLYLIFKYTKQNSIFVNSIIAYAKIEFSLSNNKTTGVDLRKSYEDESVDKIPIVQLVQDMCLFCQKIDNFTLLFIDKNHLRLKKLSNEEIQKEIAEETGKKRRNKNIKKENKIYFKKNINNKRKLEVKQLEEKAVSEKDEHVSNYKQDNNNSIKPNLEDIVSDLSNTVKNLQKEVKALKSDVEIRNSLIESLKDDAE